MQGKILAYDPRKKAGVIQGENNKSYYFTNKELLSHQEDPKENLIVSFEPRLHQASMIRLSHQGGNND